MDSAKAGSTGTHKRSVFVSHASKNFKIADEVRALLEERGISCWIAPRDIPPGGKYGTAIVDAIADCTVVVLLLTDEANQSSAVENEIERAFGNQKTIIPVRLRDIKPSKGLEFFVSNAQWVDAFVSPLKGRIDQIANIVHALELDKPLPAVQPEAPTLLGRAERQLECALRHKVLSAALAFGILALLSGAILTVQMSSQQRLSTATTSISKSADRIDGAAASIEQSSTTIKSMGAKLDGVKKETSDDPRKEIANLGMSWSSASFGEAIRRNDVKAVKLFLEGGMPAHQSDGSSPVPPMANVMLLSEQARPAMLHRLAESSVPLGASWRMRIAGYPEDMCLATTCFGMDMRSCVAFPRVAMWRQLVELGVKLDTACTEVLGGSLAEMETANSGDDSERIQIMRRWGVHNTQQYKTVLAFKKQASASNTAAPLAHGLPTKAVGFDNPRDLGIK